MNLNKEILRLSLPAIVSNITVPLLGLCDTTISGHLSSDALGGMIIGTSMLNMVFWLFGFLRMGTTGLTAHAFGAQNDADVRMVLTRAGIIALFAGIVIVALSPVVKSLLISLLSDGGAPADFARRYYQICIFGAPALLLTNTISGWLLGLQNTLWPMVIAVTVNVINIALSITFVYLLHLGFNGIALGTLSANWLGLGIAIFIAYRFRKGNGLWCNPVKALKGVGLRKFFRVNSDIFFRSACVMAVSLTVTAVGSRLGDNILAANGVMMQFFIFFSYFMDGFAFTGEALCGRFAGAGDSYMLRRSVRCLLVWSAGIAVIFFFIYLVFNQEITHFITDIPAVMTTVEQYKIWIILIPPVTVAAFIFDGFYIGLTATRRMLAVTFSAAVVFFLVCFWHPWSDAPFGILSNSLLWAAFLSYLFVRGAALAAMTPNLLNHPHN